MKPTEQKTLETDVPNGRKFIRAIRMNKKTIALVILVVAVLAIVGMNYKKLNSTGSAYQAVFLNNGQVYFGKLSNEDGLYPKLHDVFYVQVTEPQNINLVKLGSELHGPTDEMKISRTQILFIENLRADSQVVQSILQYKKSNP